MRVNHVARHGCSAYGEPVPDDPDGDLAAARRALSAARSELDEAVAAVPQIDGEETMASAELLALLFRAVKAKNHLDDVLSREDSRDSEPIKLVCSPRGA